MQCRNCSSPLQVLTLGFLNEILINGRHRADNSLLKLEESLPGSTWPNCPAPRKCNAGTVPHPFLSYCRFTPLTTILTLPFTDPCSCSSAPPPLAGSRGRSPHWLS